MSKTTDRERRSVVLGADDIRRAITLLLCERYGKVAPFQDRDHMVVIHGHPFSPDGWMSAGMNQLEIQVQWDKSTEMPSETVGEQPIEKHRVAPADLGRLAGAPQS